VSKKVNQKTATVAFFDDPDTVDEPGFYLVDGGEETSEVKVYDGGEFAVVGEEEGEDGVKIPVLEADGRGRPVFAKAPEHKETISVSHNTNGKPGRRVYPAPDGDGFTFDAPKVDDNPDKWETKGGEG
jgi:hypothetical protein